MRAIFLGYALIILSSGALCAQDDSTRKFLLQGDSLRRAYQFTEAIHAYQQVAGSSSDTLLRDNARLNILQCENGLNLLQYAAKPKVLGTAKISRESFYLYLNTDDHRSFWAMPPAGRFPEIAEDYPVFVSPPNKTMIFTGRSNGSGHLDLYISRQLNDTLWSYPESMGPSVNSGGDECFPVLSADGQTLYFASDGHYGMGGFDLYLSSFDETTGVWSQAQNMGFPYSSPENDFAFMPAPDGLSALFVSDRGGLVQQLNLYKVVYELSPERSDLRGHPDLPRLAQFLPEKKQDRSSGPQVIGSPQDSALAGGINDYAALVREAKKIKDEVTAQEKKLAGSREWYARLSLEEDKVAQARLIEEEEMTLLGLHEKYRKAGMAVQKAEAEFLDHGILPAVLSAPETSSNQAPPPFVPQKGNMGSLAAFRFAAPVIREEPVDLSFRIETESKLIAEESLPEYLFYRIQLAVTSAPAKAASFKGVSPVFESKTSAGKYLYAAGQFNSYAEASKALQQVQRQGLRNAIVIAYYQGKSITVTAARRAEATAPKTAYRVSLGAYPQGLPDTLMKTIQELSNKDLAKIAGENGPVYVIGPFETLKEAQTLQQALVDRGLEGVIVETIAP